MTFRFLEPIIVLRDIFKYSCHVYVFAGIYNYWHHYRFVRNIYTFILQFPRNIKKTNVTNSLSIQKDPTNISHKKAWLSNNFFLECFKILSGIQVEFSARAEF